MGSVCKWAHRIFWGEDGNVLKLDCGKSCKTVNFLKIFEIIHLKLEYFMVCKLYLKSIRLNNCVIIQMFVKAEMNYFSIYIKPKLSQKCQMYINTYKLHIHLTTQIFKNTKNSLQYFDGFCFERFRVMYQNKFNI